jgi:hypothetical protein
VASRVHHGGRHAALGDGGLLPLPQLRLPAPGVGRERVGGQGRSPRIQPRLRPLFLDWIDREIRLYQSSTGFRSEADRAAMLDFFAKGRAIYERLAR